MAQLLRMLRWLLDPESVEQRYLNWAKVFAAFTIVVAILFAPGLITAESWGDRTALADLASKVIAACAGFTALMTVLWRGLINDRQYQEARRSNDVKDHELRTKLFTEGIALLNNEKAGSAQAGLHVLETLACQVGLNFGNSIMSIIANYLKTYILAKSFSSDTNTEIAFRILNTGFRNGYISDLGFTFEAKDESFCWKPFYGINVDVVKNGRIIHCDDFFLTQHRQNLQFVAVWGCKIPRVQHFRCHFTGCSFGEILHQSMLESKFQSCDFSGTEFDFGADAIQTTLLLSELCQTPTSTFSGCFYRKANPPVLMVQGWPTPFDFSGFFRII